jgi:5-methylthioadenosine/S-adenosylhomocysteine deaminase
MKNKAGIIIHNGLIVTIDRESRILHGYSVVVNNNLIVAVLPAAEVFDTWEAAEVIDATGMLVMPGFVNAHTHVAMSMYRGFADDLPLKEWLEEYIWPAEAEFATPANVAIAAELAIAEMIESGTVMFADMYFFEDIIAEISKRAGMRMLAGEGIFDFPTPNCKTADAGLTYTEGMISKWKGDELIKLSLAPHAIYTCSVPHLMHIKALSEKHHIPVQIHLSETEVEVNECVARTGMRPVKYMDSLGMFNQNLIAAHMVHLTDEEIELTAARGVRVVNNPQSNLKLASGFARVKEMLKRGVSLGFGTDGAASNNNLEVLREMRTTSLVGKMLEADPTACNAKQMVEMATIGGARVLGVDHLIGSVEIGKCADLMLVQMNQLHMVPLYNIYSHIVYSMQSSDILTLLINGKVVMKDRHLLTINKNEVISRIRPVSDSIKERFFHFNHNLNNTH